MLAARYPDKVASLVLAGAPLDLAAGDGFIKRAIETLPQAFYEGLVLFGGGRLRGATMLQGFKAMHPFEQYVERYIHLYEHVMARAMGVHAARVEDPGDLRGALEAAFAHPGPALVDVVTNRAELTMPPKVTVSEATGFSLWVVKAVLNGRGDEVIDLAKTNTISGFFR